MKAYKIEILVLDFDEMGGDEIKNTIENSRYPNHCISPKVKKIDSREIEWSDGHPLNNKTTSNQEYERLFKINQQE